MKKYLLTLIIFLFINNLFAQNWCIVNPGISTYYIDTSNYISNLNINDTTTISDTTFYHNYTNYRGVTSLSYVKSSFIGDSIGILTNGTNFIQSNGKSYYINTLGITGDCWKFYQYPNGDFLEARIVSLDTLTILSQPDSIKRIQIQLKDFSGNILDTTIHFIVLSKNLGMIKFPDIYYLPNGFVEIILVGRDNPKVGITNIDSFDFNNFEIGDEFHFFGTSSGSTGTTYNKYIMTIYGKEIYNDSIIYHYVKCGSLKTGSVYSYWNNDSIVLKITLSYDNKINDIWNNYLVRLKKEDRFFGRLTKTYYEPTSFYGIMNFEYCSGLGRINENAIFPMPGNSVFTNHNLVYYRKGTETWGVPYNCDSLIFTGLIDEKFRNNLEINIYPNPAKEQATLYFSENGITNITIYNIFGTEVYCHNLQNSKGANSETINVSGWAKGMYIVKASTNEGIKTSKLLVE